jgi:predicted RNA-binding protein
MFSVCEANAYLRKEGGGGEELVLEAVDKVIPQEDGLLLEDIFGRRKIIKARIAELALVDHKIILVKE